MSGKYHYPFLWENSALVFDWDRKVLKVSFLEGGRRYQREITLDHFPIPNFYVVGGLIHFCGETPKGQAEYKLSSEGVVMDFFPATRPRKGEKALIKFKDDREGIYTRFFFNQLRLKAFVDMLEALDKSYSVVEVPEGARRSEIDVPPDKELSLSKEKGEVYVEGVRIPMPDRSALYEVLKNVAVRGDTFPMKTTYPEGRISIAGRLFEFFRREGEGYSLAKRLSLNRESALRIMCVVSPLR